MTSSLERPLLSPAAAAATIGCPVWLIHLLIERRILYSVNVQGFPKIRHRELHAFIRMNTPNLKEATP